MVAPLLELVLLSSLRALRPANAGECSDLFSNIRYVCMYIQASSFFLADKVIPVVPVAAVAIVTSVIPLTAVVIHCGYSNRRGCFGHCITAVASVAQSTRCQVCMYTYLCAAALHLYLAGERCRARLHRCAQQPMVSRPFYRMYAAMPQYIWLLDSPRGCFCSVCEWYVRLISKEEEFEEERAV